MPFLFSLAYSVCFLVPADNRVCFLITLGKNLGIKFVVFQKFLFLFTLLVIKLSVEHAVNLDTSVCLNLHGMVPGAVKNLCWLDMLPASQPAHADF